IVVLLPLRTCESAACAVPPVEALIVTVVAVELAAGQTPLCTTARNEVAAVRGPVTSGFAVETMSFVLPAKLSVDDCHFTMLPVLPLKLTVVPVPVQTEASAGVVVPPTETGST